MEKRDAVVFGAALALYTYWNSRKIKKTRKDLLILRDATVAFVESIHQQHVDAEFQRIVNNYDRW